MQLSSTMNFDGMTKEQLVQLLDSLYELLLKGYEQQHVIFVTPQPLATPGIPAGGHPLYPPYMPVYQDPNTVPLQHRPTIICNTNTASSEAKS